MKYISGDIVTTFVYGVLSYLTFGKYAAKPEEVQRGKLVISFFSLLVSQTLLKIDKEEFPMLKKMVSGLILLISNFLFMALRIVCAMGLGRVPQNMKL